MPLQATADQLDLVACPICARQISEGDINLHLDLQCPGIGSTSEIEPTMPARTSQSKNRASPDADVIEIGDTPPRSSHGEASSSKTKTGNVASIFAPRKRVKLEATESPAGQAADRLERVKRSEPLSKVGTDASEKKPKTNPLVANQPWVTPTSMSLRTGRLMNLAWRRGQGLARWTDT